MIERKGRHRVVLAVSIGLMVVGVVWGVMKADDTGAEQGNDSKTTASATKYWVSGDSEPGAAGHAVEKVS